MAQSVIDVSTVTIFPNSLPCKVYGSIHAYDNLDSNLPMYELYNRDIEHAELISETGQTLSVMHLDMVLFMQQPVISLHLKNRAENDALIASGIVILDNNTSNDYEEVKQSIVKGVCGHVNVNYIALSCALVANIYVYLYEYWDVVAGVDIHETKGQKVGQEDSELDFSIFGSIVVHYGKTYGRTNHFSIPILNIPSNQSISIGHDDSSPFIKLTRKLVAVPAYSSLIIKANLRQAISSKAIVGGNDAAQLWPINWRFSSEIEYERDSNIPKAYKNAFRLYITWMELYNLQPSSRITLRKPLYWSRNVMLEVFSISIGRENNDDLNVSGTITVQHMNLNQKCVMFEKDDNNPDRLLDGRKLLHITCPSSLNYFTVSTILYMDVKLKDADYGFLIEEGSVTFDTMLKKNFELEYDRPFCCVIPGKRGYCAVHYTMFSSAPRVDMKIVLLCKGVDAAKVHGKIFAWSDIFDYPSNYERKYYRRTLYDEPDDNIYFPHKKIDESSSYDQKLGEVNLSECSVAVPVDHSFYIYVDLCASSHIGSGPAERLHDTLELPVDEDKHEMKIQGEEFDLQIGYFWNSLDA